MFGGVLAQLHERKTPGKPFERSSIRTHVFQGFRAHSTGAGHHQMFFNEKNSGYAASTSQRPTCYRVTVDSLFPDHVCNRILAVEVTIGKERGSFPGVGACVHTFHVDEHCPTLMQAYTAFQVSRYETTARAGVHSQETYRTFGAEEKSGETAPRWYVLGGERTSHKFREHSAGWPGSHQGQKHEIGRAEGFGPTLKC